MFDLSFAQPESTPASVPAAIGPDLKGNPSLGRLSQLTRSSYIKENEKRCNYGKMEEKRGDQIQKPFRHGDVLSCVRNPSERVLSLARNS